MTQESQESTGSVNQEFGRGGSSSSNGGGRKECSKDGKCSPVENANDGTEGDEVKQNLAKDESNKKVEELRARRAQSRHRLLKKRQLQRRSYQEKNHLVRPQCLQAPQYNFTPSISSLPDDTACRLPSLSATRRAAQDQASQAPVSLLAAVDRLAESAVKAETEVQNGWGPGLAGTRPVLDPHSYQQLGGSKDEVTKLHFRTTLPPLFNKPKELRFRDVIQSGQEEPLRQLIRLRRNQKSLNTTELNHALLIAINRRETRLAEVLLMSGAQPSAFSEYNPLLVQAAFTNNTDIVRLLLQFGADPNQHRDTQYTPLYFACHRNNFYMMQVLVKAGADVSLVSREGLTHLMAAARAGNVRGTRYLLFHYSANINSQDAFGKTALHYAGSSGKLRLVKTLLKAGAAPFMADSQHITPYITALTGHHMDIADVLLPVDVDQNLPDPNTGEGRPMLWYAVHCGHLAATKALLSKGADIHHAAKPEPLIKAALDQKYLAIVRELAPLSDLNASLHESDNNSYNALQYFTFYKTRNGDGVLTDKDLEMMQFLAARGSDVNAPMGAAGTLLSLLLANSEESWFEAGPVLELGANPNVVLEDGTSCLWLACVADHASEQIPLLIEYNCDMGLSDLVGNNGQTPVQTLLRSEPGGNSEWVALARLVSAGACLTGTASLIDNILKDNTDDDSAENSNQWRRFLVELRSRSLQPRSLQQACKIAIKKRLGHATIDSDIHNLPLPAALKKYLKPSYMDPYLSQLLKDAGALKENDSLFPGLCCIQ